MVAMSYAIFKTGHCSAQFHSHAIPHPPPALIVRIAGANEFSPKFGGSKRRRNACLNVSFSFNRHPPDDRPIETQFCASWHQAQARTSANYVCDPSKPRCPVGVKVRPSAAFKPPLLCLCKQTNFLKKRALPIEGQLSADERTNCKPAMRSQTGHKQSCFSISSPPHCG